MGIQTQENGNELVVLIEGVLDQTNSTGLAERLVRASGTSVCELITIDLNQCPAIGTLGLGGLTGFRLSAFATGKKVRIINAAPAIKDRMLELHFDKIFEIQE